MTSDLRPALAGSLALHVLFLGAGLIAFPQTVRMARSPVPVTIVTRAPTADLRPAFEAPEPEAALSPELEPSTQPPAPVAEVTPTPLPKAPPPPTPPTKATPPPTFDLNALASRLPQPKQQPRAEDLDLNRLASRLPQAKANAARGAPRPETATEARPAAGAAQGLTADEASLLAAKLIRLWRPNCVAEGAADIQVRVNIQLTPSGDLAAPPRIVGAQRNDSLWAASAQRALTAVRQGEPYDELPRARYAQWKDINFNFNARQACLGM